MFVYLDNAATTKIDKEVLKVINNAYKNNYSNPSSIHFSGQENNQLLEQARLNIAKNLKTDEDRLVFCSSASEANNLIIKGVMQANQSKGKHLIISAIEHPSVYQTAMSLVDKGYQVDIAPVNKKGIVEVDELKKLLKKETVLVSIMYANNEIGTIQPIEKLREITHNNSSYFHSDLVQAIKYNDINIDKLKVDFASLSAHKFNGPLGIGLAVLNKNVKIDTQISGGEQESSYRSGTYNLPAILGLDKALSLAVSNRKENRKKVKEIRDYFWQKLQTEISDIKLNGCFKRRLLNNLNIHFSKVEGEAILIDLSSKGIEVSTGSACSAYNLKASYVLAALGLKEEELNSNIRFSFSEDNTKSEINYTISQLKKTISRLRDFSPIK